MQGWSNKLKPKFSFAMTYADFGHLGAEIEKTQQYAIDSLHIDVIDGHYVPSFAMSLNDTKFIRANTNKPLEIHMMTENPGNTVDIFISVLKKGDTVYIHPDAERYPLMTIEKISKAGLLTGLVVKPDMGVQSIYNMLPAVNKVLLLANLPIGENNCLPDSNILIRKAGQLTSAVSNNKIEIYCEGYIERENISDMMSVGITGFVVENMSDF